MYLEATARARERRIDACQPQGRDGLVLGGCQHAEEVEGPFEHAGLAKQTQKETELECGRRSCCHNTKLCVCERQSRESRVELADNLHKTVAVVLCTLRLPLAQQAARAAPPSCARAREHALKMLVRRGGLEAVAPRMHLQSRTGHAACSVLRPPDPRNSIENARLDSVTLGQDGARAEFEAHGACAANREAEPTCAFHQGCAVLPNRERTCIRVLARRWQGVCPCHEMPPPCAGLAVIYAAISHMRSTGVAGCGISHPHAAISHMRSTGVAGCGISHPTLQFHTCDPRAWPDVGFRTPPRGCGISHPHAAISHMRSTGVAGYGISHSSARMWDFAPLRARSGIWRHEHNRGACVPRGRWGLPQ